jgi:RNA polymerase sigma factor (sigma-70 family)
MGIFGKIALKQFSDSDLIIKYRESDDKLYVGELYKRYAHLVLGMCISYFKDKDEGKDAVTRIFEKLFGELKKREIENFKVWLTFVTRNFCISELRKKQVQLGRDLEYQYSEAEAEAENDPRIEGEPDKEVQLKQLEEAIAELKPVQQTCIRLFYLESRSYQEIAEQTGYSLNEVKSSIQNGKRNLKIILTEKLKSLA